MPSLDLALLREDLPTLDLHGRSRWEAEYDLYHFLHSHPGTIVHIITGIGRGVVAEATQRYLERAQKAKRVRGFVQSEHGGRFVVTTH
jgi:DNA-nicking Smr family endonuclease